MVLCRSGSSRAQLADSAAQSNRERSPAGSRNRTRAAASSSASGNPASRQQIAATSAALSLVTSKEGEAAFARSTNNSPAGEPSTPRTSGERAEAGNDGGPAGYSCSPLTRKGAGLVASIVAPG